MLQVDIDSKRKRTNPKEIIKTVSDVFDIKVSELTGKRRTQYIALARQSAMYLMREELELPLEKIAHSVNRKDHTTVIHACSKISELTVNDDAFKEQLSECKNKLYS